MFTRVDDYEIWPLIDTARQNLSKYLHSLSPEEWDEQSYCDGWLVRDVIAHLILEYRYKRLETCKGLVRNEFNINTFLRNTAVQHGLQPIDILLSQFDNLIGRHQISRFVNPLNMLVDLIVHEQDIRVANYHQNDISVQTLKVVFDH